MKKRFFIIDDYTIYSLWDTFLHDILPKLPSKPRAAEGSDFGKEVTVGDWDMTNIMHTLTVPGFYIKCGVPEVKIEQLPAIFCVTDNGIVGQYRVKEKETEEFIRANL